MGNFTDKLENLHFSMSQRKRSCLSSRVYRKRKRGDLGVSYFKRKDYRHCNGKNSFFSKSHFSSDLLYWLPLSIFTVTYVKYLCHLFHNCGKRIKRCEVRCESRPSRRRTMSRDYRRHQGVQRCHSHTSPLYGAARAMGTKSSIRDRCKTTREYNICRMLYDLRHVRRCFSQDMLEKVTRTLDAGCQRVHRYRHNRKFLVHRAKNKA